jgi:hypothetical protein
MNNKRKRKKKKEIKLKWKTKELYPCAMTCTSMGKSVGSLGTSVSPQIKGGQYW